MAMQAADALNRIFSELKVKNDETRARASYDLLSHVVSAHRGESTVTILMALLIFLIELPPDKFPDYYGNVISRVQQLLSTTSDTSEKCGGLSAIEQLTNFNGDDAAAKSIKFGNLIKVALRSNDNTVLVYAARALGRLAVPGGALTAELVEFEVKSALESLQSDRQESRRFSAVLAIRELAKNSPTLLYAFVPQILECIWVALRDVKVLIRETAAEAVGACLEIVAARDSQVRQVWFSKMYEETIQGFRTSSIENLHGSLLTLQELLQKGGMFMHDHYREACEIALRLKEHKEAKIRSQIVFIIPVLAAYAPTEFSQSYLHKFQIYLHGQLKKDKERNAAFKAIGKVSNAVGSAIAPYLDGIVVAIRQALSAKT